MIITTLITAALPTVVPHQPLYQAIQFSFLVIGWSRKLMVLTKIILKHY